MERLKKMASRVAASANRITNFPVLLVMKALSASGITRAITRLATKAIRTDRLMRASVLLVSVELVFFGIVLFLMALGFSRINGSLELAAHALRMLLLFLTAGSVLLFRYTKVKRRHSHGDALRALARDRRKSHLG
ncbi:hypothetical protein IB234_15165 [Pseudomonas sp. PDM16]|uniref:hypothetical protein n=1 Tax=Pseudomonas sp. PDM16 TaxID=2769292 RepID=UPI00178605BD|nr:hypothetical protein [Pseudomonas sp. PDM16]MBD9415901.1 hypothetical protein [Pseudomonas sp. PDM16]